MQKITLFSSVSSNIKHPKDITNSIFNYLEGKYVNEDAFCLLIMLWYLFWLSLDFILLVDMD